MTPEELEQYVTIDGQPVGEPGWLRETIERSKETQRHTHEWRIVWWYAYDVAEKCTCGAMRERAITKNDLL